MNDLITGTVIHGLGNGRKFGFPTANVQPDTPPELEKGVYAVWVYIDGKRHEGMLYVGTRPTLSLSELTYEINIFDFTGDLYGQEVVFVIVKQLRPEQVFDSWEALSAQLAKDRTEAKRALEDA
ncbi:MAG: riboflavin kinase [Bacteroidales bacterium]|nr:riboflavin kinase [Bacteroidales bacterium]